MSEPTPQVIEAAERFSGRVVCPNCEGLGRWGGKDAQRLLNCPRCNGTGYVARKLDRERIEEAGKYSPATYASLLGTLTAHPDFQGIHRVWHWSEEKQNYDCWVVTLWPKRRWHYHTQPKASIVDAILEALRYLEDPVEPKGHVP